MRYLFGPVSREFAEQNLAGPRQAGACLAFNPEGDADLAVGAHEDWEAIRGRLPAGWEPDLVVLNLAYNTVPLGLWSAPVPRVALATDIHLLWHYYRHCLPLCDFFLTDSPAAECLARAGIDRVRAENLCGCARFFVETPWPDESRDIDILFIGNINPAVQRERAPWLARLARYGTRRRVVIRTGLFGDSYARLLARTRIVFQYSARGKCGRRSFEAAAAGALVFQEEGNRELPNYFRDRRECVYYRPNNLEELLDHYLDHEDKRRALAEAARERARACRFEDFWADIVGRLEADGQAFRERARPDAAADPAELLTARCWQALGSTRYEDLFLLRDLERAAQAQPESAVLANALGVVVGRQSLGRGSAAAAAEVAAEHFRRALAGRPSSVLAGLNLAEALDAAGQRLGAVEAARRTLEVLNRDGELAREDVDGLHFGLAFDPFRLEWERAAWANVGQPAAEVAGKRDLIAWRLYALLGRWTGELPYHYEAAFRRPDLPSSRAGVGLALVRANRASEAVAHLRPALAGNPFDPEVAFTCFQALGVVGDGDGRRRLAEERRLLSQAAPAVVPPEAWFSEPRPKGNELASVIVLCSDQLEHTRLCLDSVLEHTRPPYELIVVDNGSTDGTPDYLEEVRQRRGPARVEVVRNDTDCGVPAACNQGLARARGRYLVFLNDDTVVAPGWLEGLVSWSLHDWPRVGLVGPVTNHAAGAQHVPAGYAALAALNAFAAGRRREFAGRTLSVRRLTGSCLLVRREVFDRVGGFDERFGLGFFDDEDLCVRAREAGFHLLVALDLFVHHSGSRTFEGLGPEARERLQESFETFKAKWGEQYVAGLPLLPPPPEEGAGADAPAAPAPAGSQQPPAASDSPPAPEPQVPLPPASSSLPLTEEPPAVPPSLDPLASASGLCAAAALPALAGKTRTSLCMIVRNEEEHLPDCLRSVQGLFGDVVVVDTGSTDRTREIAREFGARVYDFPWIDSFGAARNESLRHAVGKWVMWLDADDRVDPENRERLAAVLAGLGDERDAYAFKVRSILDPNGTSFRVLDQVRLFRNLPEFRWDYRIHEQILPAVTRGRGVVRWANVTIDHVGYVNAAARRGKLERNLRLLELDHAERPEDGFGLFNLGWTLLDLGRTQDPLEHLEHALERTNRSSSTLRKLYHLVAIAYRNVNRREEALTKCREGLRLFPDDGELLCEEGLMLRDQADLVGAEQSWLRLLDARRGQYFASEEVGLRGYKTRQLLAEIYRAQERFIEAEVQWRAALSEAAVFEPAWQGLADLYLRHGRWSDLDYLLERLESQGLAAARVGWVRARGQTQRKEWAAARRTLDGVIAQDPQAVGPRILLSQVHLQEGRDWAAAERALRDVLALEPQHAETRHNLGVLLRRLGRVAVTA